MKVEWEINHGEKGKTIIETSYGFIIEDEDVVSFGGTKIIFNDKIKSFKLLKIDGLGLPQEMMFKVIYEDE